jgi:hypothetical protein
MNALVSNLVSTKDNLNVSIPVALAIICEVAKIWFPTHSNQLDLTEKVLAAYGLIAAANAGPVPPPAAKTAAPAVPPPAAPVPMAAPPTTP